MANRHDAGRVHGRGHVSHDGPMTDRYADFTDLTFDRPAERVLRITLDGAGPQRRQPGRAPPAGRRVAGRRPRPGDQRRAAAGRGQGVLGRRQLRAHRRHASTTTSAGREVMREARDLVLNVIDCSKPIVSAIHGAGGRRRAGRRAAGRRVGGRPARPGSSTATPASAWPPATTRRSAGRCCAAWPRPSTTCYVRRAQRRGGRAHRAGVAVRRRRPGARPGARGRRPAGRRAPRRRSATPSRRSTTGTGPSRASSTPAWPTSSSASAAPTCARAWPATPRSGRPASPAAPTRPDRPPPPIRVFPADRGSGAGPSQQTLGSTGAGALGTVAAWLNNVSAKVGSASSPEGPRPRPGVRPHARRARRQGGRQRLRRLA